MIVNVSGDFVAKRL